MPSVDPSGSSDPGPASRLAGFGTATAVFVVVSSMIGTGVLTTSGFTMYFVGSNQLMLALWVIGGLVAICGALTLAELASTIPKSGGDYVFLYESYGPLAGFLSGWVSFLIGFGAPIAASAFAAGKYLLEPLALPPDTASLAQLLLASAIILAFTCVHAHSRPGTVTLQAASTLLKLAILIALAAAGLYAGWGRWQNLADRPPLTSNVLTSMLFSMVYISYAYTGWNGAGYLAGEIQNPQRNLPRAILGGTSLVLLLYLALNLFYALALPISEVQAIVDSPSNTQGPDAVTQIAGLSASRLFGPNIGGALSVAIGLTMLASLSAFILTGPRVVYAMSRAGQFPSFAGRLHPRSDTPHIATWLQGAWSLIVLWSGSFEKILVFASVGLALFSLLTVSSVYVLRWRRPDLPRPFRTPGYPFVPAVFLLATGLMTGVAFYQRPDASLLSLACIVAGIPLAARRRLSLASISGLAVVALGLLLAEQTADAPLDPRNPLGGLAALGPWFVSGIAAVAAGSIAAFGLRRFTSIQSLSPPHALLYLSLSLISTLYVCLILLIPPHWRFPLLLLLFFSWLILESRSPWPSTSPAPGL